MIDNFDFLNYKQLTDEQKQEIIQFMTDKGGKDSLSKIDRIKVPLYKIANFLKRFPDLQEYFLK
jgi:hypothetical protein